MTLLLNSQLKTYLKNEIGSAKKSLFFMSAFIKNDALIELLDIVDRKQLSDVTIVSRWRIDDLTCGASDIEIYEYIKKNNWQLFINDHMHFKLYLIDDETLFIGSANITQKGLGISGEPNDECSIQIIPETIDIVRLKQYLNDCCMITDEIYEKMKNHLLTIDNKAQSSNNWPTDISQLIQKKDCNHLWVNDLLFNSPINFLKKEGEYINHDYNLLNFSIKDDSSDLSSLSQRIKQTSLWKWLFELLDRSENEYVRFGEITAKLHNSLLDDPKPYRKTVKNFVSNIFEWVRYLNPDDIGIKKFNHTEALFLTEEQE